MFWRILKWTGALPCRGIEIISYSMSFSKTSGRIAATALCLSISFTFTVLAMRAVAYAQQRRPEGASRRDRPGIKQDYNSAALLREAAELLQAGRLDAAEPQVRRALALAPENADAHNLLGAILDQRGKALEAEREYRSALRLNPKAVGALANLGVLLARTHRPLEAAQAFESALHLAPNHPQASFNLGLTLYQLNRLEEAAKWLEVAAAVSPGRPEPLYYLGLIASARGQSEAAIDYWHRALALQDHFAEANFMLAEELRKNGRVEDAKEFYERALDQDQEKLVHYVRLGGVLLLLGQNEKALEIFRRGAERFPATAEAHYFVAIAARGRGDYEMAETSLRKSLALQPDNPDALAQLGFVLGERARFAEAEQLLRRALRLSQDKHFMAHYDLGRLLVKQQRYDEAIPILERGATLNARYPGIHYQLFLAFSRLKRKAEADRELVLFKQLEAESKSRRRGDYSAEDLTPDDSP
jgi:tetratricopeptide (TPR) repeat protein